MSVNQHFTDFSNLLGISVPILAKGTVNLVGSRLAEDAKSILHINSCTWHDDDSACRLLDKPLQQGYSLLRSGSLTRGEQAVTTQGNNCLQSLKRLRTDVESAVKSDAQPFCFAHKTANP